MERVRCASAMSRRVGQGIDNLELLDDRAGPAMRDDERKGIVMPGTNVDEMNVQSVDCGDELREGIEACLDFSPVIVALPVAHELTHGCERHALGLIGDGLLFGPSGRRQTAAEIDKVLLRNTDAERTDGLA